MLQIVRTFVYVFFLFFLFAVIVFSVDKYNYREIVRIVLVYLDTMSNSFNDEFALNDPNGLKSAYFYFFRTGFKECLFIISFLLFFFCFLHIGGDIFGDLMNLYGFFVLSNFIKSNEQLRKNSYRSTCFVLSIFDNSIELRNF